VPKQIQAAQVQIHYQTNPAKKIKGQKKGEAEEGSVTEVIQIYTFSRRAAPSQLTHAEHQKKRGLQGEADTITL